jgi:hypothetical protein
MLAQDNLGNGQNEPNIPSEEYAEVLRAREALARLKNTIRYLSQSAKYAFGYLYDYPYMVIPKFEHNPCEIVIRVWWDKEEYDYLSLPLSIRKEIQSLQEQYLTISKSIMNLQIPQPVADNGAGKPIVLPNASGRDKDPPKSG